MIWLLGGERGVGRVVGGIEIERSVEVDWYITGIG